MPGQFNISVDNAVKIAREAEQAGIAGILLFGLPEEKDEVGSDACDENGIVQKALRAIRENVRNLLLVTDICLCEYTSHGHCGVIKHGDVQNDPTLKLLADSSVSHVRAGADMVAPSDMMDGRVAAIRQALDSEGFSNTPIMAYAAKYASGFYGPFREAAGSTPQFGDRRSYQMDPPNAREALREIELDIDEGADIVMVKPALPYLDIIARARERFDVPLAAYQVSGEYAMIERDRSTPDSNIGSDIAARESDLQVRSIECRRILDTDHRRSSRVLPLLGRLPALRALARGPLPRASPASLCPICQCSSVTRSTTNAQSKDPACKASRDGCRKQ